MNKKNPRNQITQSKCINFYIKKLKDLIYRNTICEYVFSLKISLNWLQSTLLELQGLLQEERKIGVKILEILQSIEQRKAYSELGYEGLFTFCIRELKFTESQAFQRIQAMRALKAYPELKEKIQSGSLSVTTVSQVQVFLRQEEVSGVKRDESAKFKIFQQVENKTSKEVKEEIAELKGERVKTKLILELDEESEALWREVRSELAHASRSDAHETFKNLMKEFLKKRNSPPKPRHGVSRSSKIQNAKEVETTHASDGADGARKDDHQSSTQPIKNRDQNQYQNCGSRYALQFEHKTPFAYGGTHELSNLTLLCRNCNLHQGVKRFGTKAMKRES